MRIEALFSLSLGALLFAGTASAAIIDFVDGVEIPEGVQSYTTVVDGLEVTIEADPLTALLTQGSAGIGIDGFTRFDDPTVIDSIERLTVSFDVTQVIDEVHIGMLDLTGEVGWYRLDGGDLRRFDSSQADDDGTLALAIGEAAGSIELIGFSMQVLGYHNAPPSDFTVQGILTSDPGDLSPGVISPMPEPGSMAMFGLGGILVGWAVRRRI